MTLTTVVNIRYQEYDEYCGRAGHGQSGYFGNPFPIAAGESRESCIQKFRSYFYKRLESDPEFKCRVHTLKGKRLGCFCAPKACHCDIIAEYVNNLD